MKKALLSALALLLMGSMAAAVQITYSGEIDRFTGEPVTSSSADAPTQTGNLVMLGGGTYYDRADASYVFPLGMGAELRANVTNGMITRDKVSIQLAEGMEAALYCDGNLVAEPDYTDIELPGSYVLSVNQGTSVIQPLKFTIVERLTGKVSEYFLPDGFSVSGVMRDGSEIGFQRNWVDLEEEGTYQINYFCRPTGVEYELSVEIDHTPPVLALEAVEDGVARGPVELGDLEDGASVFIERNGQPIGYTSVLRESGSYEVTVQDRAGNTSVYKFVIQVYLNLSSWGFFIALFLLLAAILVFVVHSRESLRVR